MPKKKFVRSPSYRGPNRRNAQTAPNFLQHSPETPLYARTNKTSISFSPDERKTSNVVDNERTRRADRREFQRRRITSEKTGQLVELTHARFELLDPKPFIEKTTRDKVSFQERRARGSMSFNSPGRRDAKKQPGRRKNDKPPKKVLLEETRRRTAQIGTVIDSQRNLIEVSTNQKFNRPRPKFITAGKKNIFVDRRQKPGKISDRKSIRQHRR